MADDEAGFNKAELRVLAFLADEKGHAQWEMCDRLKFDKGYLSKTLKGLKDKGLIFDRERSLVRPGKRGPQLEYPYYIQNDQLPDITRAVLSQIRHFMAKAIAACYEREKLEENGVLTPELEEELTWELLNKSGEAEEIMNLFQIPLYRNCASKIFNVDCISYEGICDLIYGQFGLIKLDAEQKIRNPEDFFQIHLSNIEQSKKIEAERRRLEAGPIAIQKIKELWAKGERTHLSRALGYSQDAVIAQINQMLTCKEISL